MTPLNLEQTLSYLRERMPAPFDLPQLAHLCRTGQLTPLFSHNGKAIYYTAYFTAPAEIYVNGYLTAPTLINLIDKDITLELFKGYIYKTFNDNVHLHLNNMTVNGIPVRKNGIVFVDIDYSYGWPDRGTGNFKVKITRNDLLFDLEQLDSITGNDETAKLHTRIAELENKLATLKANTQSHTPINDEHLAVIMDKANPYHAPDLAHAINLWLDLYNTGKQSQDSHHNRVNNWIKNNTGYSESNTQTIKRIREITTPLQQWNNNRSKENQK